MLSETDPLKESLIFKMAINGAVVNADLSLALMNGEKVFVRTGSVRLSISSGGYVSVLTKIP